MAVIIGSATPRDTVTDTPALELLAAWGVHTLTLGERTFVYVTGINDSGLSAFELDPDGSLASIQNIPDDPLLALGGATDIISATVGGNTYLYVAGFGDSGVTSFQVAADGRLTHVETTFDTLSLVIGLPVGPMSVLTAGSDTFLVVSGQSDSGFTVFRIQADGTLIRNRSESDDALLELDGARPTATATVDGRTFIFVAGFFDNGLSVFERAADGDPTNVTNVPDDPTLNLNSPSGLATVAVSGTTYLIASGVDGLSVFAVSGNGQLTNTDNVSDSPTRALAGANTVTPFLLDGETFVAVSARGDSALNVFHLGPDGTLTDVTTVFDTGTTALDGALDLAFVTAGSIPFLIGTGINDNGLTTFSIGSGDDVLTGTAEADLLLGLLGADLLDGAAGDDRMLGGSGDDAYVVDSAGDAVVEQAGAGTDTVRSAISFTLGDNLEHLLLLGTAALSGTGNALDNALTGNAGTNRLRGLSGRDSLLGCLGNDKLEGGRGRDSLEGGKGADDFVWRSVKDSGPSRATRDQVLDLRGRDDVVLTRIDAVKGERGNQAFVLDEGGDFEAGEIRLREVRAGTMVEMNTDADARVEMSILLRDFTGTLAANDFGL